MAAHIGPWSMSDKPDDFAARRGRWANAAYAMVYRLIAALFALCATLLVGFSGMEVYAGLVTAGLDLQGRFAAVLEAIGMLTIAVAALELSQTVWEEEVQRQALMSAPTRVRRFLSRFLVVVVVALAIEALISAFRFAHDAPEHLPHAAAVAAGAASLLLAWGVFVRLNRSAEVLEPEAMERAKREDDKIEEENGSTPRSAQAEKRT
jgi:hypothetical protein